MANGGMNVNWLSDRLDRHGADFASWPDPDAARRAREMVLAEPKARAALDEARNLEALLDGRFETIAGEAADSQLAGRLIHSTAPALSPRSGETRRWTVRIAASFLAAALLGGAFESLNPRMPPSGEIEVLALDALLYGPGEGDLQ